MINAWFYKLPLWAQLVLLFVPGVNWIMEILVRWSAVIQSKGGALGLVLAIAVSIFGLIMGWVDAVFLLVKKHLLAA